MRRTITIVALLLVFVATGEAQDTKLALYLDGSYNLITAPDLTKDLFNTCLGLKAGIGVLVNPRVELVFSLQYYHLSLDGQEYLKLLEKTGVTFYVPLSDIDVDGGAVDAYGVMTDIKYIFPSTPGTSFKPYLIGGLGIMHGEEMNDVTLSSPGYVDLVIEDEEGSDNDIIINFGACADIIASSRMAIVIEARYMNIFEDEDDTSLLSIGAGVKIGIGK